MNTIEPFLKNCLRLKTNLSINDNLTEIFSVDYLLKYFVLVIIFFSSGTPGKSKVRSF